MQRTTPQLSVIMPVRNGAETIAESLDSLLQQTLRDLEVIVVDDGSTDATPEILTDYGNRDSRIRVLRRVPAGIVSALRAGVDASQTPLVARLDADDLAYSTRLEQQRDCFQRQPDLVLLGTAVDVINWRGDCLGKIDYPESHASLKQEMTKRNPLIHSTIMMRRSAYDRVGGYRTALQMAEDYDLWCRLSEVGQIGNLRECLGAYRKGNQTYSTTARWRQTFAFSAARYCARARMAGRPDPLGNWPTPLSLEGPCPDELRDEQAFFRQLRDVSEAYGDSTSTIESCEANAWGECLQLFKLADGRDRHQRRLAQDAMVSFWQRRTRKAKGARYWATLFRCLQLDPWRFPQVAGRLLKRTAA